MDRHNGWKRWRWNVRDGDGCRGQTSKLSGNVDQQDKRARSCSGFQCCLLTWLLYLALTCLATVTQAQESLEGPPPGRPGLPQLPTLEEQPSKPQVGPILPPLPPVTPAEPQQLPQQVRVLVRQIKIVGNTVFPMEKLSEVTQRYVNRELATEDLEALRLELTHLYIDAGYINSGAIIPDQKVSEGVITLQIIEGELSNIEISGTKWFRDSYIRKRIALGAGPPLNIGALQERLQFLQQDERIARLNAELRPGVQRGESALLVQVEETNPFKVELAFNNYQSPTVGAERGLITVTHQNLTGHGDPLSVTYGRSKGIDVQIDASYAIPLTVYDTTLGVRYRRNTFNVVEAQFQELDVQSRSEAYSVTLRQPIFHTLTQEFAIALSVERQENQTAILGEPFSFSLGTQHGRTAVTALRLALEWTERTQNQVLAARSRLSLGIDAFNSTISDDLPDSRFVAWLGQVQWARRLT